MKNPKWQRDELILALNLYFTGPFDNLSKNHPDVIKVSEILNNLNPANLIGKSETYRNADVVFMKLGNFQAIDPADPRRGLPRHGKLDEAVFLDFVDKKDELSKIANTIKELIEGSKDRGIDSLGSFNNDEDFQVREGKILFSLHRFRERDPTITKIKKKSVLMSTGRLECEVCNFDFNATYGKLGFGFAECHHLTPVSQITLNSKTKIRDLAIVCSNCHRMLHRGDNIRIDLLREIVLKGRNVHL